LQHIFHVTKDYLMELKNEEYWHVYTSQILCTSPDMKITSKGRPKSSQIRTDIDIREQHDRTQEKHVPTLLDCVFLVLNYVSFRTNYLMYH